MSDPSLESLVDLLPHEAVAIADVVTKLNADSWKVRNAEGFRREVIERFEEINLVVQVTLYEIESGSMMGAWIPAITVTDRIVKPKEFDHERMLWEVQSNVDGLDDTPGAMQPDGTVKSPDKVTSLFIPQK